MIKHFTKSGFRELIHESEIFHKKNVENILVPVHYFPIVKSSSD